MTRRLRAGRRKTIAEMSPRELHRLMIYALRDFEAARAQAMGRAMLSAVAAMQAQAEAMSALVTPPDGPPLKH